MEDLEMKNEIFKNRPPNVWNEPESLEPEHFLKYSASPFTVYKDGRVRELSVFVYKLGEVLYNFNAKRWENLVNETIEVFLDLDKRGEEA